MPEPAVVPDAGKRDGLSRSFEFRRSPGCSDDSFVQMQEAWRGKIVAVTAQADESATIWAEERGKATPAW